MLDILIKITEVSSKVSKSEFEGLRIKEELLCLLVQNPGIKLSVKNEAFKIIEKINKRQLEILGHKIGSLE